MKKMGNIIDKLYQIQLNSKDFLMDCTAKDVNKREWELYTLLYEHLQDEDKEVFLEYIKLKGERQNEEIKASFGCGIRTAMRLFVEGLRE